MRAVALWCVTGLAIGGIAASASGQVSPIGRATRAYTGAGGVEQLSLMGRPNAGPGMGSATDTLLWTHPQAVAITEYVSLAPSIGSGWAGQALNTEKLQRFSITGDGTPLFEFPAGAEATAQTSAASGADLVAFVDRAVAGGPFTVRAFRSTSPTEVWSFELPAQFTGMGTKSLKVSRDGSTVAFAGYDQAAATSTVWILDGATGAIRHSWTSAASTSVGGIDLTDTGSLALLANYGPQTYGRVFDTSTMTEVYPAVGSGGGGTMQISGDGDVVVVGGFSLYVYTRSGGTYTRTINFNAPTSWFGYGSDVSRDGSTVGVMSHNYASGYLDTEVRIWDVASSTLLGTQDFHATGSLQNTISGGAMSDDGSVFAVASWGSADNANPEVMIFDRGVQLITSLDTPGSPFSIDISGDGRYVMVGTKAVHANNFGNGGGAYMIDTGVGGECYANCDGSTTEPALNVLDFNCFLNLFNSADTRANCDGSTTEPMLNVLDFNCFINAFNAGCP